MTKISVIVPVYNVEEYLEECLDSIINQTLEDIEVICVNDGSTDNSLKILKKYAKKDNRIKIINQKNCGLGCARNSGLNQPQGDYIFFLDSDDFIPLNALELTYNNAISNNSELIMFKIARFNDFEEDYSKPGFPLEDSFNNEVDFNNFTFTYKNIKKYVLNSSFSAWSKLYKKDFLEKWGDFKFPVNTAYEDVLFHAKALLRSDKISFVPEFLYKYRTSNVNSITHTESNAIDIFKVCDSVESFLKKENYFEEFEKEFYEFKVTQILQYLFFSESEEYFTLTKRELSKINSEFIPQRFSEKYLNILNSSLNDLKIKTYKSNIKNLKKENKKLNKQNKQLNKELKNVKKLNKQIINSNSWKITKPIRSIKNKIRK